MIVSHPHPAALALVLIALVGPARADDPPALRAPAYSELPLGAIKPAGWLKAQLELQASGLGGHLDEFWPDIKDSAWIGGKAEGWERAPYWLDGVVPLAFLLDDPALKAKVKRFVDYILEHQHPDGWLGPIGDSRKHKPYDVWPLFVLFKAFLQYEEATGDPRIVPAMLKACRKIDEVTTKEPLYSWAQLPWRGPDRRPPLAPRQDRRRGRRWRSPTRSPRKPTTGERTSRTSTASARRPTKFDLDTHGVNTGMGLKFAGVRYRRSGDPEGPGRHLPHARHARPVSRPGHGHLHLRRAPGRAQPVAGDRALHRGRGDVLARTARGDHRRCPRSATGWRSSPSTPCRPRSRRT